MSYQTIPRFSNTDKFTFLVILGGIVKLHLQRWPVTWTVDVLATILVTLLLVPAWALYRLVALVGRVM